MSMPEDEPKAGAVSIRVLQKDDAALPHLASLMEEMQAHYRVPCPATAEIISGLQDRPQAAEFLIAEQHEIVVGFCAFSAIFPGPGLKPGLFLKELYVGGAYRSQGVGRLLMGELARLAHQRGLSRIDWTADAQDGKLLRFYNDIGGVPKPDKLFYRLDGEAFEQFASSHSEGN